MLHIELVESKELQLGFHFRARCLHTHSAFESSTLKPVHVSQSSASTTQSPYNTATTPSFQVSNES